MDATAKTKPVRDADASAGQRIARYDWTAIASELDSFGAAVMEKLLSPEECREIASLYPHEEHFRSHVVMARHGFGKGEYRYFKYPLSDLLGGLRTALYPSQAWRTSGTSGWESTSATRRRTRSS
jgi:uncharacterized protein